MHSSRSVLGLLALLAGSAGCELIASVDPDLLPGATASTTATTATTGAGGAGGTGASQGGGGEGGLGGEGGAGGGGGAGGAGGGSGGAGGAGGSGGAGGGPTCVLAADCPDPQNECLIRTCVAGQCGTDPVAAGTPTPTQVPEDCQEYRCDGSGMTTDDIDDTDLPVDDDPCTEDVCTAGAPTNPPVAAGASCGVDLVCDGMGACVGCIDAGDCPGQDDDCQTRTCDAGVCGVVLTAAGTATSTQTAEDCKKSECDGAGNAADVDDDTDLPVDDNDCTADVCTAGAPSNPATSPGTACDDGGGSVCDGAGACVECVVASTCPGSDTECQVRTCVGGMCGASFTPAGTPLAMQTSGDCQLAQCNGMGGVTGAPDATDVPADGNQCTGDVCTAGVPSNPPTGPGTGCSQNGGTLCNGAGACVECLAASDCPGSDTECATRTCTAGVCGVFFTAQGNPIAMQTPGDCQVQQCDGMGGVEGAPDGADVPADDGNQCTGEVCAAGVPSHPPSAPGAMCNQSGGTVCNGSGACVQCISGAGCPSGVCSGGMCAAPSCTDDVMNGDEVEVDCGGSCPACPSLVINEADYDQIGSDTGEFIEIWNNGTVSVDLTGWILYLVNGANNAVYLTVDLGPAGTLAAGQYLVVGSATVTAPAGALKLNFVAAADSVQNGAPDAIALVDASGPAKLEDAFSYEGSVTMATLPGFGSSVSLVEGTALPAATADSNTVAGSLSRLPNGTDTNNAATDWAFTSTPTPGAANVP